MAQTVPSNPESLQPPSAMVFTLGQFHVEVDGQSLRFGHKAQRRPLELLKLLIALGGDSISVEKVTDSLWPDSDGDQAQGAFTSALHRLRKLIGHDALQLTDSRITLDPGYCWVDSQDFQETLARASQAVEAQDGEGAWSYIEHALALYRGPFLEGEFVPVEILSARENLHGLFLRHIQQLSEYYLRAGHHARATVLYQRGLEADELAEEFYQGLMRCYGAVGHLGEVESLYQRCRKVLRASADIDPSPETEAVYQALISGQRERIPNTAEGTDSTPEPTEPLHAPTGLQRATRALIGSKRNAALTVAAVMLVALSAGLGGWIYLVPSGWFAERSCLEDAGILTLPKEPSIAVLAFDNLSGDPEQEYYSDALTENIITKLAAIRGLFVIARHSSFKYKGEAVTPQQVGRELGVRYVLEGSVQRTAETIRITAQLIDTANGKHLWAEKYDGELKGAFDFRDAIVRRIAFALDTQLVEGDIPAIYNPKNPEAFDLVAKAQRHFVRKRKEDNKIAQKLVEQALALDPNYGLVLLGWIHFDVARYGWSASRKQSKEFARRLAMRAIANDEEASGAYGLLAFLNVLDGDFEKAVAMGERALALVPNNAHNQQRMAFILQYGGRPKEAIAYVCKAMRLNPFFPAIYWGTLGDSYRLTGDYVNAIAAFQKVIERKPDDWKLGRIRQVAAFIHSGRVEEGREVARQIMKLRPKFSLKRYEKSRVYKDEAETKRLIDALRKAGLSDKPDTASTVQKPVIAVLAFDNLSSDKEQEYFSDGISESIITRLARLEEVVVIARNSSFKYKGKAVGIQQVGQELGATYVLEGSVQKAGGKVRISAQLIETATDKHAWAEQYDRELKDVFGVQDDITRRVVDSLGAKLIWGEAARSDLDATTNLEAYDLFLRGRHLYNAREKDASLRASQLLQRAIELDPNYTRAMAVLGENYIRQGRFKWTLRPEQAFKQAEVLAKQAMAVTETDPSALRLMSVIVRRKGEYDEAIALSKRALEMEPNNYEALTVLAWNLDMDGQLVEALQLITRAMRLWPHPPPARRQLEGWINLHAERYEAAERIFRTFQLPPVEVNRSNRQTHLGLIMSLMFQGREDEARREAEKYKKIPEYPYKMFAAGWRTIPWKDPQRIEREIAMMRKAGFEE